MDESEGGEHAEMEEQDDGSPVGIASAADVFMVHTDEVIEYYNTVLPQSKDIDVYEGAVFEKIRY